MRSVNTFFLLLLTMVLLTSATGTLPPTIGVAAFLGLSVTWGMLTAATTMNVTRGDVVANTGFDVSYYPKVTTADTAKDVGVDIRNAESVAFLQVAGAIVAAGLVKLVPQECATLGGVYTDVAAADLDGAFTDAAANTTQKVGYKGTMDFVALRADWTSGTSTLIAGVVVRGNTNVREVA
jgi:hypothetical protein